MAVCSCIILSSLRLRSIVTLIPDILLFNVLGFPHEHKLLLSLFVNEMTMKIYTTKAIKDPSVYMKGYVDMCGKRAVIMVFSKEC